MEPAYEPEAPRRSLTPLTRVGKDGPLKRSAEVESQLLEVVALSPTALRERASISDYTQAGHLREEVLVYLIRDAHRREDESVVNSLSQVLLRRCARRIEGRLRGLGRDAPEEGFQEVVAAVFGPIVDLGTDKGDFLQVRFWLGLDRRISDVRRAQLRRLKAAARDVSLTRLGGADGPSDDGDDLAPGGARVSEDYWASMPVIDDQWTSLPIIAAAFVGLPPRAQEAFVLRHVGNWPVESDDPDTMTISRALGVTGRTVRSDLAKAEAHVARWRQGAVHLR